MGTPDDAVFANQLGHFYQTVATRIGDYIHQHIDTLADGEAIILADDQSRITSYANTFYSLSDKIAFENSGPSFQQISDATGKITDALISIAKTNKLIGIAGGVITLAASVLTGNIGGIAGSLAALIADIAASPKTDDD